MRRTLATLAALVLAAPAMAQMDHSSMPGMKMPPKPKPTPAAKAKPNDTPEVKLTPNTSTPEAPRAKPKSTPVPSVLPKVPETSGTLPQMPPMNHDMSSMPEMEMKAPEAPSSADPHAGHDMSGVKATDTTVDEIGSVPAPPSPTDHAADAVFGADKMARARKVLAYEVGGMGYSLVVVDLFEVSTQNGKESYRFEGEAFTGGNINRFGVKVEGEGGFRDRLDDLEVQALYSRAIAPYWNLQIGIRHDLKPDPSRTYFVTGVEGFAPYWFKVNAAGFVSNKGEVRARLEAYYDQRITQALILQPRVEANIALQDIRVIGVGSGLTDFEAGLRLRYEIKQEIAPYIGIEWRKKAGDTARFARLSGEDPDTISFVAGIRIWF